MTDKPSQALFVKDCSLDFYERPILKKVSLAVRPGEICLIVGPNGSGKTIICDVCCGLIKPNAGNIIVDGIDVTGIHPLIRFRKYLSRLFQRNRLFERLSVVDNLIIHNRSKLSNLRTDQFMSSKRLWDYGTERNILLWLKRFQLSYLTTSPVGQLSKGEQRLIAIICAVIRDRPYLILDEPFVGLAPHMATQISRLLNEQRELGKGILLIEHRLDYVKAIIDQAYFLSGGILRQYESLNELSNSKDYVLQYGSAYEVR